MIAQCKNNEFYSIQSGKNLALSRNKQPESLILQLMLAARRHCAAPELLLPGISRQPEFKLPGSSRQRLVTDNILKLVIIFSIIDKMGF